MQQKTTLTDIQKQFEVFKNSKTKVPFKDLEAFFAQLPEVHNEEMIGKWKGGYIKSGGIVDLALKDFGFYGWIGKHYYSENKVHALMHQLFGFEFNIPVLGNARIREILFRGKVSSSMMYNYAPIIDHFRRVDENTLMGVMDVKGKTILYFYLYK